MRPAIVMFAKSPRSRNSKTRLAADVGSLQARRINTWLTERLLALRPLGGIDRDWIVYAASEREREWFEDRGSGWEVRTQAGGNLGDRLSAAFDELFSEGHQRVIIIGSDMPDLNSSHVSAALDWLATEKIVLGPTFDGGYYLVAQRSPGVDLFSGVNWHGRDVFRQTLDRAVQHGLTVKSLPVLLDVDTGDDWLAFLKRNRRHPTPIESGSPPHGPWASQALFSDQS